MRVQSLLQDRLRLHDPSERRDKQMERLWIGLLQPFRERDDTTKSRESCSALLADGRSHRSIQRDARVAIPERVPELLRELARAMMRGR